MIDEQKEKNRGTWGRCAFALLIGGALAACQTNSTTSPATELHQSPSAPTEVPPSGDVTNGANGPSGSPGSF